MQAAIGRVREAAAGQDLQAIRRAIGELEQASQALAQHLQRPQQPAGATARAGGDGREQGQGQAPDDVIDAQFEVKT